MGPINIDLRPLFVFAFIGMALSGLAVLGGFGWLIWFAINHVRII